MILRDDQKSGGKGRGCAVVFVLFLGFIGLVAVVGNSEDDKEKANPTCKSNWHLCSDNADLVNNYTGISLGQIRCEAEAKEQARYGEPKFPSFEAFGTFYRGDDYVKNGMVTLVEKEAQFQNGFGAMVHSTVICKYDLNAEKVIDVNIIAN